MFDEGCLLIKCSENVGPVQLMFYFSKICARVSGGVKVSVQIWDYSFYVQNGYSGKIQVCFMCTSWTRMSTFFVCDKRIAQVNCFDASVEDMMIVTLT